MKQIGVSIEFFGGSGSVLLERILNQSSNNRARKVAFNNFFRLAKASGLIPTTAIPLKVEIACDRAGQQHLQFVYNEYVRKTASANVAGRGTGEGAGAEEGPHGRFQS